MSLVINWRHAVGQSDHDVTTKCVAFAVGAHMNATGEASPSQMRLAAYASCSTKTVERAVLKLEADALLIVKRDSGRRNLYLANLPDHRHPDVSGLKRKHRHPDVSGSSSQPQTLRHGSTDIREQNHRQGYVALNEVQMKRNGDLKKHTRPKVIEDCMGCRTNGPVTDTGELLLCDECLGVAA